MIVISYIWTDEDSNNDMRESVKDGGENEKSG